MKKEKQKMINAAIRALDNNNIPWQSFNEGIHILIDLGEIKAQLWPTTGRFRPDMTSEKHMWVTPDLLIDYCLEKLTVPIVKPGKLKMPFVPRSEHENRIKLYEERIHELEVKLRIAQNLNNKNNFALVSIANLARAAVNEK